MPRTDKSITVLTGMIIAALYVILLVGFSQESYMRHDAARRDENFGRAAAIGGVSKHICRAEFPFCVLFADAGERRNCMTSIEAVRRYLSASKVPLTLDGIRRAMNDEE
jgi:hypothetical protein